LSHTLIFSVEAPINVFKNQIRLLISNIDYYSFEIIFPTHQRHIIKQKSYTEEKLITILTNRLDPKLINGTITSEEVIGKMQTIYPTYFKSYKIRFTQSEVDDVISELQKNELITHEPKMAHRY